VRFSGESDTTAQDAEYGSFLFALSRKHISDKLCAEGAMLLAKSFALTHGLITINEDFVRIMHDAVENSISNCSFTNFLMPASW